MPLVLRQSIASCSKAQRELPLLGRHSPRSGIVDVLRLVLCCMPHCLGASSPSSGSRHHRDFRAAGCASRDSVWLWRRLHRVGPGTRVRSAESVAEFSAVRRTTFVRAWEPMYRALLPAWFMPARLFRVCTARARGRRRVAAAPATARPPRRAVVSFASSLGVLRVCPRVYRFAWPFISRSRARAVRHARG